jgi:hypothetical protein
VFPVVFGSVRVPGTLVRCETTDLTDAVIGKSWNDDQALQLEQKYFQKGSSSCRSKLLQFSQRIDLAATSWSPNITDSFVLFDSFLLPFH